MPDEHPIRGGAPEWDAATDLRARLPLITRKRPNGMDYRWWRFDGLRLILDRGQDDRRVYPSARK